MAIDYSKWDKIELSDDSDIEVHPNVDKNSFIKWKQRDIHEKRQQRNIEIKSILVQLTMYAKLNERVDFVLKTLSKEQLLETSNVTSLIDSKFDPKEKFDYEQLVKGTTLRKGLKDLSFDPQETASNPPYNEMIEDLFIQIKQDHPDAKEDADKLIEYVKEHRAKIDEVLSKQTIKLDELLYEKANLISSDDIHTGFDRSFMNKDETPEDEIKEAPKNETKEAPNSSKAPSTTSSSSKSSSTVTSTEVINTPKSDAQMLDELSLLPETEQFSKIPFSKIDESATFLMKNTKICTEQQKDALIMTAFDLQLENNSKAALQVIHQSLLLQYISQLAGPHPNKDQTIKAIKLFCSKIADTHSPANQGFIQDVQNTFKHIQTRCEILKREQGPEESGEEEAVIQLKALDDGSELLVNIPVEGTPEYEIFTTKLSPEFQAAVKTQSLDEVNKEFSKLKVEDAEKVLEVFNECGVIGINGYIEDEEEFKELQKQYNENMDLQEGEEEEDVKQEKAIQEEQIFNTVDEVD